MVKIDYKKELKTLYYPPAEPQLVQVPPLRYLMIDGQGDPNTAQAYADAVAALYALAYAIKFEVKKTPEGPDFTVMPLEGLWWTDHMEDFSVDNKDEWKWTMMIMQPEPVNEDLVHRVKEQVAKKKDLPSLKLIRFGVLEEGEAAQIMHTGPYAEEEPTIRRLHGYIQENGLKLAGGKHHEIYLGDPRKTAPERLRTVIRQPVGR